MLASRWEHATAIRLDRDALTRTLYGDRPPMIGPLSDIVSGAMRQVSWWNAGGMAWLRYVFASCSTVAALTDVLLVGHASTSLTQMGTMRAYKSSDVPSGQSPVRRLRDSESSSRPEVARTTLSGGG